MIRIFIAIYRALFIIVLLHDSGGVALTAVEPQEISVDWPRSADWPLKTTVLE